MKNNKNQYVSQKYTSTYEQSIQKSLKEKLSQPLVLVGGRLDPQKS